MRIKWLCEQGILFETKHRHLSDTSNEEYMHVIFGGGRCIYEGRVPTLDGDPLTQFI